VSRQYEMPETSAADLRRRLDGLDTRVTRLDGLADDVTAIGHALGQLTERVTALGDATTRTILTAPDRRHHPVAASDTGTGAVPGLDSSETEAEDGQPDWLTVTDPDLAAAWLTEAMGFADDILARFPHGDLPGCWPLHAIAVVEVVALHRQWVDAHASTDPAGVSELLARWLPTAVHRIRQQTGECGLQRSHQHQGRAYRVPHLDAGRVADWWIQSRASGLSAPDAFAMTAVT
jgi:hypothetical protein